MIRHLLQGPAAQEPLVSQENIMLLEMGRLHFSEPFYSAYFAKSLQVLL